MLKVGLTGGIGAGKSLVAARLCELGAVLVDADVLAREVVAPGSDGLTAVVGRFGAGVLRPDGNLDRAALGAMVFGDPVARAGLNAIVHPRIRARARELEVAAPRDAVVVHDIPLLVETGQASQFHLVVVVEAPVELRVARLVEHRGMSEADARSRIAAQAGSEERRAAADVVIENSGTREDALAAVDALWARRLLPLNDELIRDGREVEAPGPAPGKPLIT
jgi:dephospho-CoA kinase